MADITYPRLVYGGRPDMRFESEGIVYHPWVGDGIWLETDAGVYEESSDALLKMPGVVRDPSGNLGVLP